MAEGFCPVDGKKIKYLHILGQNEFKFARRMIEMLQSPDTGFVKDEHIFITRYARVNEQLSKYDNVYFEETDIITLLNKYGDRAEWIFVHSMNIPPLDVIFKLKTKYAKKIVWRTWGHDIYSPVYRKGDILKNICKRIVTSMYIRKMKKIALVGIAGAVDTVNLEKKLGKTDNTFIIPYGYTPGIKKMLDEALAAPNRNGDELRVMIGHSGFATDNHEKIIKLLSKYKDENVRFILMLPYGESEYMKRVIECAKQNLGDKTEIFDSFMEYPDFVKYVAGVDIGIMDQEGSSALGTIGLLIKTGKKIFLNENGVMLEAFGRKNVECYSTKDIVDMDFAEFSAPVKDAEALKNGAMGVRDEFFCSAKWHELLDTVLPGIKHSENEA